MEKQIEYVVKILKDHAINILTRVDQTNINQVKEDMADAGLTALMSTKLQNVFEDEDSE